MKRMGNLYENICKYENILAAYKEVCKNTNNFIFLGRNSKGKYSRYRTVNRKIKRRIYLYKNNSIKLSGLVNTLMCYETLCKKKL